MSDTLKEVMEVPDTLKEVMEVPDTLKELMEMSDTLKEVMEVSDTLKEVMEVPDTLRGLTRFALQEPMPPRTKPQALLLLPSFNFSSDTDCADKCCGFPQSVQ